LTWANKFDFHHYRTPQGGEFLCRDSNKVPKFKLHGNETLNQPIYFLFLGAQLYYYYYRLLRRTLVRLVILFSIYDVSVRIIVVLKEKR